jgi:hypothetical protein
MQSLMLLVLMTLPLSSLAADPAGNWWQDPATLSNYSRLHPKIKKVISEQDFQPLANFFAAYPPAASLFAKDAELRQRLKASPQAVSAVIQACSSKDDDGVQMPAAKLLRQCPAWELWKIGSNVNSNISTALQPHRYTDKKENQIFLIYKKIQSRGVAKSYMRKGLLIYEEMRKYFPIYEELLVILIYDFATAPL